MNNILTIFLIAIVAYVCLPTFNIPPTTEEICNEKNIQAN